MAHLLRTGWFQPVPVRTMDAPVLANDSEVVSMTTTESSLNSFKGTLPNLSGNHTMGNMPLIPAVDPSNSPLTKSA
jgi:hypothetical protein